MTSTFKEDLNNNGEAYKDQLTTLIVLCGGLAKEAGWWTDLKTGEPKQKAVGDLISLIHSEISEAYEHYRKDWRKDDHLPQYDGLTVELADAVIRIFDMAHNMNLDLANALIAKLMYNTKREDHKIENRQKDGGKKV